MGRVFQPICRRLGIPVGGTPLRSLGQRVASQRFTASLLGAPELLTCHLAEELGSTETQPQRIDRAY